jgi:dihydroorotase
VAAVRAGLVQGVVDAIATDHAPHAPERKDDPFDEAPPGMLGLETALAVAHSALCLGSDGGDRGAGPGWVLPDAGPEAAVMSLRDLLGLFSWRPARIARLGESSDGAASAHGATTARRGIAGKVTLSGHGGPIRPGAAAHLTVFDPTFEWVVDPARQASRSRNTPYSGRRLTGKVRHTVFAGEIVVLDGQAQR